MSKFNISPDVTKGECKQLIVCSNCNHYNSINTIYKLTYQKIKTVVCPNCGNVIKLGDIFNFTTGTKLNDRNEHNDLDVLDAHIWNSDYDKI